MAADRNKSAPRWKYLSEPLPEWVKGTLEERFSAIYRNRFWEEAESLSGPGSSRTQARRLIEELPRIWQDLGIAGILDIPCGDFNWMQSIDLSSIDYIGGDIVEELIESNQNRYGRQGIRFIRLDITRETPPQSDFVLCRDLLVHFSYRHIRLALDRFLQSGADYLMTTTFPNRQSNKDIATGDWRPLNLQKAPFFFPPSLELLVEACPEEGYEDKCLGLWRFADLEQYLKAEAPGCHPAARQGRREG